MHGAESIAKRKYKITSHGVRGYFVRGERDALYVEDSDRRSDISMIRVRGSESLRCGEAALSGC